MPAATGRRAAALAALAWLAACAAPPDGGEPAAPPAAGTAVQDPSVSNIPVPAEASVPVPSLLYVRGSELLARFGDPHGQRRDGGAIVWNYEADGLCRLNLVLQGVRGTPVHVVHAQARLTEGGSEAACLDRLRQEARISSAPVIDTIMAPAPTPAGPRAAARPPARPAASRPPAARPPAATRPAAAPRPAQAPPAAPRRGT